MEIIFRTLTNNNGGIDASVLVPFLSSLVALLAVIVSVCNAYFQVKHHRLSVLPILDILCKDYKGYICVYVKNKGTGPARVTSTSYKYNGNTIHNKKTIKALYELFGRGNIRNPNFCWKT